MLQILFTVTTFLLGVCLGSFINVVTMRFGTTRPSIGGRSFCPACKKTLRWWELVPVLSYGALRGKCSACRARISFQYPVVEIVGGLAALYFLASAASILVGIVQLAFFLVLLVLFLVDWRTFILPDFYVVLLGVLAATSHAYNGGVPGPSVIGGTVTGAGFLLLLWLITRGQGIGLGDVKLAVALGFMFGLGGVVAVLFISFISGGMVGLLLLITRRATPKTAIPFGPFLTGAAMLLLVWPGLLDVFQLLIGV